MSIFDTTAPTGFNSFGSPMNSMNMNSGNWGMDSNYLTPSFDAPYRPPYMGGQGHIANQNPGFFRSAYGLTLDPSGMPYGVGNNQQDSSYWDQVGNRPTDFGAAFGQRVGVPLAAFGLSFGISKAWQTRNMSRGAYDWSRMFGAGRAEAMRVSGFTAMGQRFGSGIAKGLVGGASLFAPGAATGGFARAAAYGASALGGAAASIALPTMIAQGAIGAADNMVFDNYIGTRENSNMLRSAFSGVTFGGGHGDPFTGQGISRRNAGRMGGELTQIGASDQIFNAREVASMGSMASQMGMFDNISPNQITSRMKSLVNQIKIVMSVAGTTDFKEAMNMMARLQMAGVSAGSLGSTVAGIGSFASQAGISTSRLFNTMGAQGQYLFQANGLTPAMGMMTASASAAGMGSAFRTGLISQEQMARMGGLEGAVQSSLTGQLNASQTTYNMMRNFNRYTTGAGGQGVVGNISNFGRAFAGDPLGAYGALMRTGRANASRQFGDDGPLGAYNQMKELADVNPITANRKISQDQQFALYMQMGMSPDQAQAYMSQLGAYADPNTQRQMAAGARSARINLTRDWLEQTEQTRFRSWGPVASTLGAVRSARSGIAGFFGSFEAGKGGLTDNLAAWWTGSTTGSPDDMTSTRMSDDSTARLTLPKTSTMPGRMVGFKDDIDKIKALAQSGDPLAIRALSGKGDAAEAIYGLAKKSQISSKYVTAGGSQLLAEVMNNMPVEAEAEFGNFSRMNKALEDSPLFFGSTLDKAEGFRTAFLLQKKIEERGYLDPTDESTKKLMDRYSQLTGFSEVQEIDNSLTSRLDEINKRGINVSNRYEDRQEGDTLQTFMARNDGAIDKPARFPNPNVSREQNYEFIKQKETMDKQESMRRRTMDTLLKEGRIDLASGYQMMNAGSDLKEAAGELKEAASDIKEAVGGSGGTKPTSLPKGRSGYTEGSLLDKRYNRINPPK